MEINDKILPSFHSLLIDLKNKGFKFSAKKKRNSVLADLFDEQIESHNFLKQISCNVNVAYLLEKVLTSNSIEIKLTCCSSRLISLKFLPINIHVFDDDDCLSNISNYITIPERSCDDCEARMCCDFSTNDIVYVDCQKMDSSTAYSNITVDKIQVQFTLSNKIYVLKGVINFNLPITRDGMGHYTSLLHRPNGKWEVFDDLLSKPCNVTKNINPVILVYSCAD